MAQFSVRDAKTNLSNLSKLIATALAGGEVVIAGDGIPAVRLVPIAPLDGSVLITLRHESLASPEQIVMQYLEKEQEITNSIARDLTGIKSENSMKQVFYKLRESYQLEQVPKVPGKKPAWRKPAISIPLSDK